MITDGGEHRPTQVPLEQGQPHRLSDHVDFSVEDGAAEIPRLVEDRAVGGLEHADLHFFGRGIHRRANDLDGDGINHSVISNHSVTLTMPTILPSRLREKKSISLPLVVGTAISSITTRYTRTGLAMFFTVCSPRYSYWRGNLFSI